MHEIITIQLGQQANYAGTHYWNSQESYFTYSSDEQSYIDHDVSFRPGIGADGSDTYTPRALVYDLKGAFGSLRRENALYQTEQDFQTQGASSWHVGPVPIRLPRIEPSPYQQALDRNEQLPTLTADTVRFWSDFNHVFYHPRSIVQLDDYELNSSLMPFERWNIGDELFANLDRDQDILDRDLRPFLEECDHLQGIQVVSSTDDAWGGFASRYLERIADDLGKGHRWIFGLQDSRRTSLERHRLRVSNLARSVYTLGSSATMHVPMVNVPSKSPRYLSLTSTSRWHTAAMQAVAIESITLPTRLRRSLPHSSTFDNLEMALAGTSKRSIASCAFSVKDPNVEDSINGDHRANPVNGHATEDVDQNDSTVLDIDMCPDFTLGLSHDRQHGNRTIRLFSKIEYRRGSAPAESNDEAPPTQNRRTESLQTYVLTSTVPFPLLPSFPPVFHFGGRPQELGVNSSLSTTSIISERIRGLEQAARSLVGVEEREDLCDGLATLAEEYEDGWMSDQDDSDYE